MKAQVLAVLKEDQSRYLAASKSKGTLLEERESAWAAYKAVTKAIERIAAIPEEVEYRVIVDALHWHRCASRGDAELTRAALINSGYKNPRIQERSEWREVGQ